jgi:threonine synthase
LEHWTYVCESCGHTESIETEHWRCPVCGGAFGLEGPNRLIPDKIDPSAPGLWRYGHLLPVDTSDAVSLGEGMTALVPGKLAGRTVRFKLDALLPTGSFKDRGAALLAAHLNRIGRRRVIVDSSGNAAAALSGYSAAAGLECAVFAPAATSPGKLVQSRAFGAAVTLVEGTRDDVARAAQDAAANDRSAFYASHNWHPVFVEGVKTWMLEVWEQLGGRQPAMVFVPTGGGSALVGAWRGIQALPGQPARLVASQPAACAPVVSAVERGTSIEPTTPGTTIAEGTKIGSPSRSRQILAAISETQGTARAVSEQEIVDTLRELWGQGLYVEPTAAVGAAACRQMILAGDTLPAGDIVVLLTGSGLKATETIEKLIGDD